MRFIKRFARRAIRFATREVCAELDRMHPERKLAVRVDVEALVNDLCGPRSNAALQRFFAGNHRFVAMLSERNKRAAADTYDFVDAEMPLALFNPRQMEVIASKRDEIMKLGGSILDLGVYKGSSTRNLAKIFPGETIHGFDSFEGLPEDWTHASKGTFGELKGALPDMPDNVRLYKGWFEDTLPPWFDANNQRPIALLRVDCDIYSSTKTIFSVLGSLLKSGTWIVFDELIGYRGFREHELRAFMEFIRQTGFSYRFVAYGLTYTILYLE